MGLITPEHSSLIEANYVELARALAAAGQTGFATFAAGSGFNRRCCGKAIPQTKTDRNKVVEGQKAMIARLGK